jgi:hypothetical protein
MAFAQIVWFLSGVMSDYLSVVAGFPLLVTPEEGGVPILIQTGPKVYVCANEPPSGTTAVWNGQIIFTGSYLPIGPIIEGESNRTPPNIDPFFPPPPGANDWILVGQSGATDATMDFWYSATLNSYWANGIAMQNNLPTPISTGAQNPMSFTVNTDMVLNPCAYEVFRHWSGCNLNAQGTSFPGTYGNFICGINQSGEAYYQTPVQ